MAVSTNRPSSIKFHKTTKMTGSSEALKYVDWRLFTQNRPITVDFISTFTSTGRPGKFSYIIEAKKGIERDYKKQLLSYYYWTRYLTEESPTWQPEAIPEVIVSDFTEPAVAKPLVNVFYVNQNDIDTLLGSQGKTVLNRVVKLIKDIAHEEDWPLEKIEIRHIRDFEVKDWEYIVVALVFNCTFEIANAYLEDIYQRLEALVEKLSSHARELIAKLIYLDIETNKDVPSS